MIEFGIEKKRKAACFAARAAGNAVATAHVPQHAYGSAYYALKAIAAKHPGSFETEDEVAREYDWQSKEVPEHLRDEIFSRLKILKRGNIICIKLHKDSDF